MKALPILMVVGLMIAHGLSLPVDVSSGPGGPIRWYSRQSIPQQVIPRQFTAAIAYCDATSDVATGGGFTVDQPFLFAGDIHVFTSVGCQASGLCAGPSGQDGWIIRVASDDMLFPGQEYSLTCYVTCTRP
jgi:hypothetical protein